MKVNKFLKFGSYHCLPCLLPRTFEEPAFFHRVRQYLYPLQSMEDQARQLQSLVNFFRVDQEGTTAPEAPAMMAPKVASPRPAAAPARPVAAGNEADEWEEF